MNFTTEDTEIDTEQDDDVINETFEEEKQDVVIKLKEDK